MGNFQVRIEVLNEEAMTILEQLERLHLIRLIEQHQVVVKKKKNWIGVISRDTGKKMIEETEKARHEWEQNIS
jgi:hypothetical protein